MCDYRRILLLKYRKLRAKKNNSRTFNLTVKDQELRRKIILWRCIQQVYMPCAAAVRANKALKAREAQQKKSQTGSASIQILPTPSDPSLCDNEDGLESAVDMDLCLPSALPVNVRESSGLTALAVKEARLRLPQCRVALATLRRRLRTCAKLFDSKRIHTAGTGTRPNTRMQTLLESHATQRDRDVERYRAARKALVVLDPAGSWQKNLRPLLQQDIHAPIRGQATSVNVGKKRKGGKGNLESEGRRTLSWIWRAIPQTEGTSDEAINQELEEGSFSLSCLRKILNYILGLRVEWAKSLARAERWEEEVLLLREEMRRVLVVFEHQAQWWRSQGPLRTTKDPHLLSGLRAYAEKQASIREQLASDFASMWLQGVKDAKLPAPTTWPAIFATIPPSEKKVKLRLDRNKMRTRVLQYIEPTSSTSANDIPANL